MNMKQFIKEISVIMLAFIGAFGSYFVWSENTYHDTADPEKILKQATAKDTTTTIVFHKSGCADCNAVVKHVNKSLKTKDETDYVVIDTKNSDLYKAYNVVKVPTIITLHQGKEIARYSGTNKAEIANIIGNTTLNK